MKLALLLATAASLLTPVLHAQEPKEVVEVNLAYALKFHLQQPAIVQGNNRVTTSKVFAIKTADIIRLIGQKEGKSFSKKARLINQSVHLADSQRIDFLIRDGGTDHLVTPYLDTLLPLFGDQAYIISKGKTNVTTGFGAATQITIHQHNIALTGTLLDPTQGFELIGPGTVKYKVVGSTKLAVQVPLVVPSASIVFSGRGIELDGNSGFVTGTVKLTGPKVLK